LSAVGVGCGSDDGFALFDPLTLTDAALIDGAAPQDAFDAPAMEMGERDGSTQGETSVIDAGFGEAADARGDDALADVGARVDALGDRASPSDAVAPDLCSRECESKGIGTCVAGECVIRCDESRPCTNRIVCPGGMPCRVLCSSRGSCSGGIDCTLGSQCDISCTGSQSCMGIVECAGTRCAVGCLEQGSCSRLVSCSADQCEVSCVGGNSCAAGAACLGSPSKCNITCGGTTSCAGVVMGSGVSQIQCSGTGSCPNSVSCSGQSCTILCNPTQSCGGAVCCQATQCSYSGTDRRCSP
jgi:hypothetical protein